MPDIYMYVPDAFAYVTGTSFTWRRRSYWNALYPNTVLGFPIRTQNEPGSDDWIVCDPSTQTALYPYKGNRVSYSIMPFIMVSQTVARLYNIGFEIYANPSDVNAEQYGGTTYKFCGAGLSPTDKHDADKSNGSANVSGFGTGDTGLIPLGVMTNAEYIVRQSDLQNLKHSTYWTNASIFASLSVVSSRVVVTPSKLAQAMAWWKAGAAETGNYNDGIVNIGSYDIKKWGDGGRSTSFLQYGTSLTSNSFIEIPSNGAIWGYIYMTATNANYNENYIKSDGSGYNVSTHGRWTTGGLRNAGLDDPVNNPWNAATAYPRRIEYGMHVVARKAGN